MSTARPPRLLALAGALALAACSDPDPFGDRPVPEPTLFAPGVVSTEYEDEAGITFSADGTEAYFTRGGGGRGSPPQLIYGTRFEGGAWTEPRPVPFSVPGDESPFLTRDGSRLLFSSRREMPLLGFSRPNNNLWMAERIASGWTQPVPLRGDVNRARTDESRGAPARSESGPVLLADGTLLYWTNEDAEWGDDLYLATERDGAFVDARPLRVNTPASERHPALSPDGRYLFFQTVRELEGLGELDLWVAERNGSEWGTPRLLPEPVNGPANDGFASFSPDGRYFFFASDRAGAWSIYYVEVGALGLER